MPSQMTRRDFAPGNAPRSDAAPRHTSGRHTGRHLSAVAVLAGIALGLSGCGSDATGDGDSAASPEYEPGPLEAYFTEIYGGPQDEDAANAQMMRIEEATAACMAEQGFEYIPMDYSQQGGSFVVTEDEIPWGTREFAEQYGYGITTQPMQEEMIPDENAEEWIDPNQEYVEAMSEAEREAYYIALYGEQTFEESADGEAQEYDWTQAGCSGRAQQEANAVGIDADQMSALEEEMNAMWEAMAVDPRFAALDEAWATCLADAGFPGFTRMGEAEEAFSERANKVYEEAYSDQTQEMTEEEYMAIDEEVQRQLAEISSEEIETAVADFTCREEVRYEATSREISLEYEQEFVDTHRAELEAWVESAKAARE